MKAKQFRRVRQQVQYFEVEKTSGMFGEFGRVKEGFHGVTVLARNDVEAIQRARKRGYGRKHDTSGHVCSESFAEFRVKPKEKPNQERYVHYY